MLQNDEDIFGKTETTNQKVNNFNFSSYKNNEIINNSILEPHNNTRLFRKAKTEILKIKVTVQNFKISKGG